MKYLAVLGRITELSVAELTALYGDSVHKIGRELAVFEAPDWRVNAGETSDGGVQNNCPGGSSLVPCLGRLGGTMKLGYLLDKSNLDFLEGLPEGKITLGVSDYSRGASGRTAMREAMTLKKELVKCGRNVRVLSDKQGQLSTATSHHNQLGEKPKHVELIRVGSETYVSMGAQNISAYARRDQMRPARDAKVGMLPPKLAQILVNLCGSLPTGSRVLDPFCGTGVVLQEAMLMGYRAYGTDLSERMVEYTKRNLKWLVGESETPLSTRCAEATAEHKRRSPVTTGATDVTRKRGVSNSPISTLYSVSQGDATTFQWTAPIDAVACETYLGPPMSEPPAEMKLKAVKQECGGIIMSFLKNISGQLDRGTPLALATPAWLRSDGSYSGLNLLDEIRGLGYNVVKYSNSGSSLLYYRAGQVVAREIIVLRKK